MPVEQNSLDFPPRPDCSASEFGFIIGGEENAAPPHFPPLHFEEHDISPEKSIQGYLFEKYA